MLFGYACHCTTLGGEFNKICGEWAGYACDEVERQSPGAVAMAIIGCGADANPEPRRNLEDARQHGAAAAAEVNRLLAAKSGLTPLPGRIACQAPAARAPARAAARAAPRSPSAPGSPAPGGSSPVRCSSGSTAASRSRRPCPTSSRPGASATTWPWSSSPARWSSTTRLRLKWETDADRLWVAAYSNDVPCYIPSRRILSEGGYEADSSIDLLRTRLALRPRRRGPDRPGRARGPAGLVRRAAEMRPIKIGSRDGNS